MSEMEDGGGWLWLLIAFGLVALGAAMAYAGYVCRSARRRAREELEKTVDRCEWRIAGGDHRTGQSVPVRALSYEQIAKTE